MTFSSEIMEWVGVSVIECKQPKGVTPQMSGHKFSSGVFWQESLLYKTLVRPLVSYGAEAWTMTKKDEQAVLVFERKIF
jgi:hypothetical protein